MQARDPHSRIDQQVAVASPDMPDIALHDANHVRLPDPRDAVGQPLVLEPTIGNPQGHTAPLLLRGLGRFARIEGRENLTAPSAAMQ